MRTSAAYAGSGEPTQAPAGSGGPQDGYDASARHIRKFADTMEDSATGVAQAKEATPRFDNVSLPLLAGIPLVGLIFVNRYNTIVDTWKDSVDILADVLRTDSGKVFRAADNYIAAERAAEIK